MVLQKNFNLKAIELKWQEKWREWGIFKFDPESKKPIYSIDTPPPTISGELHIGHAFSYSQTEYIARYKRMKGYNVFYPMGFDNNGLPTAKMTEKIRNVKSKDLSRKEFIKMCEEETEKAEKKYEKIWRRLGISCDWDLLYTTIEERVQRLSQLSFLRLNEMDRVYRKMAPSIWCPECQTAIAQVELEDKEKSSQFNDIVFKIDGKPVIISTTRPELLPACVAVFYHPEDDRYKKYKGKKAEVPLFDYKVPVLEDERVEKEKGTGIVMCCTFGDLTDIEWFQAHNLPLREVMNEKGKMNEKAGKYKGLTLKEARKEILKDLKEVGLLKDQKPITHTVNVHERCGKEVEFLSKNQWFIKYLNLKDKYLEAGEKLNWYPEHMDQRYKNWIKGLQWDWCISRQRYYGIPFPVWYCEECGESIFAEKEDLPVNPLKDKAPVSKCPKCGSDKIRGEEDVLDTWATSALTPLINSKWQEDSEFFDRLYPMNLRANAHDIISFWDFNTVVMNLFHTDQLPFKDVMISGYVKDEKGRGMSKSKGNVVYPLEIVDEYSADIVRWWASGVKLGEDLKFREKDLINGEKFLTKLWNASRFISMHLENLKARDFEPEKVELEMMDKWILNRLNEVIEKSTEDWEKYQYSKPKRMVEDFFWHEVCDNYLEFVKHRLYQPEKYRKESKKAAQYTLYKVLLASIKLLAPIIPHITEELYQQLFRDLEKDKSIHISSWPEVNKSWKDKTGREIGELGKEVISSIRQWKGDNDLPLNQELDKVVIETSPEYKKKLKKIEKDVKGSMKIKELEFGEVKKVDVKVKDIKIGIEQVV